MASGLIGRAARNADAMGLDLPSIRAFLDREAVSSRSAPAPRATTAVTAATRPGAMPPSQAMPTTSPPRLRLRTAREVLAVDRDTKWLVRGFLNHPTYG